MTLPVKNILSLIIIYKMSIFTSFAATQTIDSEKTESILSTIENIISNEEFVLQEIYSTPGTLSALTCILESPSAIWAIEYCNTDDTVEGPGYWDKAMAGEFSIKNTDKKIDYYLERANNNVYKTIEQTPEIFITEQPLWFLRMSIQMDKVRVNVTFTEQTLSFLQTIAKAQKQLIEAHGSRNNLLESIFKPTNNPLEPNNITN